MAPGALWTISFGVVVAGLLLWVAGRLWQRRARRRMLRRGRPGSVPGRAAPEGDGKFHRLQTLMREADLFRDPDLDEVSLGSVLGLSRVQLRQLVARHTGASVRAYIDGYRVRDACRALQEDPGLKLGVLARRAGFRSRSSLYRAFRTRLGCSPSAWRRRHADY